MTSEIDLFREAMLKIEDVELGTPATEAEIAAFEARYEVKFPVDIREYFLKINGVYQAGGFITIEALKDWKRIIDCPYSEGYITSILPEAEQYFRFGCYDISVWDWSIRLGTDPSSLTPIVVTHEKSTSIAKTFSCFLWLYRNYAPEDLLGYSPIRPCT